MILSNGFISSVRSVPKYFSANQTVGLLKYDTTFGGRDTSIYWPEFSTYLNGTGVSIQGEVFAKVSGYGLFGLALEKNVLGQSEGMDITASFATSFGKWHPEGSLTLNTQEGVLPKPLAKPFQREGEFCKSNFIVFWGEETFRGNQFSVCKRGKERPYKGLKLLDMFALRVEYYIGTKC